MPRRNKNRQNKSSRRGGQAVSAFSTSNGSEITRVCGSGLLTFSTAVGDTAAANAVSPDGFQTLITRFADLMEAYQLFRFTSLKLRCYNPDTIHITALGYSNGDLSVVQASTIPRDVAQLQASVVFPGRNSTSNTFPNTSPQLLTIGRGLLCRDAPNKWWRTQPGTAVEVWEEQQGELVYSVNVASVSSMTVHCFYTVEFTSPVAPALIPKEPPLTPAFIAFVAKKVLDQQVKMLTS